MYCSSLIKILSSKPLRYRFVRCDFSETGIAAAHSVLHKTTDVKVSRIKETKPTHTYNWTNLEKA